MRYKRDILIVALLNFFLTSTVLGAIPAWDKTFGGSGSDSAASVIQNQNGEYVIAGTSSSYGAGGYDAWLIITDSKGNWLWDKSFGGRDNDLAASVIQTSDDGYMIAGTTSSYGAGGSDVWLVKTNSKGNWLWDKTFGGKGDDLAASVIQTFDGGYIIAGTTSSYGAGGSDVWLIKTDHKGNWLWDKPFGGKGKDSAASVIQTSDDGYIIAGTSSSYGAGNSDAWLIKTDSRGNLLWDKAIGGKDNDSATAVQQTSDNGYIIAGTTSSYGAGSSDAWSIKIDPKGNWSWDKPFGGTGYDSAASVQQTSDNGYIIAGITSSYSAGGTDVWLIKTDSNGNRTWDKTFGGAGNDSAASVQQSSDGEYIIAGTTSSYSTGGSDAWLIYVLDDTATPARKSLSTPSFISTNKSIIIAALILLASLFIIAKLRKYKL